MEKDKSRVLYLDNICGLLIIDMVFFVHIRMNADVTSGIIPFINRLLCFFMPWFFYKSGMFYRDEDWKQRIRKDFRSLLVPYFYFTLFGWIIFIFSSLMSGKSSPDYLLLQPLREIVFNEATVWNGALWFLPSLFAVKWLACVLYKRVNVALLMVTALVLASVMHFTDFNYPLYLGNIMLGLFFYSLGYLMKNAQFRAWALIPAIAVYVVSIVVPFITNYFDFRFNTVDESDNYFLVLAYSVSGIVVFNNLFKCVFDRDIPVLSGIGRNSITVLCVHYPVIKLFTGILLRIHPFTPAQMWIVVSLLLIPVLIFSVWLINKKAKFLIGNK
jgi:fucose 4-O-acetylase-like acetyltransferase